MAEGLDLEKQALRNLAAQHLGVSARDARVMAPDLMTRDEVAALLALPVDASQYEMLQDPLTGADRFVFGLTDWFRDDITIIP